MRKVNIAAVGLLAVLLPSLALAQITVDPGDLPGGGAGGVLVDAKGLVQSQQLDAQAAALLRKRAADAARGAGEAELAYISLPRLLEQARNAEPGKLPGNVRYLGGITQLRYVLVYPDQKDLVLVGTAEPIDASNPFMPVGVRSGRPVLQLEDLIVAFRVMTSGKDVSFGCSIDPNPKSLEMAGRIVRDFAGAPRARIAAELRSAMGPQTVRLFGVPADSRMALSMVMADYRLKRMTLGDEPVPVAGVGHAMDNSRAAASRVWFEPSYNGLLASADGLSFELRGQRLKLLAGELSFDSRGATPKAKAYAQKFTTALPKIAQQVPEYADLQNIVDIAVVAALIHTEGLDRKAGFNFADATRAIKPQRYVVPRQADTIAHVISGTLVAGGVVVDVVPVVAADAREVDAAGALNAPRSRWNGQAEQIVPNAPAAAK